MDQIGVPQADSQYCYWYIRASENNSLNGKTLRVVTWELIGTNIVRYCRPNTDEKRRISSLQFPVTYVGDEIILFSDTLVKGGALVTITFSVGLLMHVAYQYSSKIVHSKNTHWKFSPNFENWSLRLFFFFVQYSVRQLFHTFYCVNLLNPTGHVMHQQFNIQQLYALPTLYLCVLYLSENKQRLVPLTA